MKNVIIFMRKVINNLASLPMRIFMVQSPHGFPLLPFLQSKCGVTLDPQPRLKNWHWSDRNLIHSGYSLAIRVVAQKSGKPIVHTNL
jgi:hypothetical protein